MRGQFSFEAKGKRKRLVMAAHRSSKPIAFSVNKRSGTNLTALCLIYRLTPPGVSPYVPTRLLDVELQLTGFVWHEREGRFDDTCYLGGGRRGNCWWLCGISAVREERRSTGRSEIIDRDRVCNSVSKRTLHAAAREDLQLHILQQPRGLRFLASL